VKVRKYNSIIAYWERLSRERGETKRKRLAIPMFLGKVE
jgi:hypothetical protein